MRVAVSFMMRDNFCKDTKKIVRAAGGAVVGGDGRVLMMLRRGVWDLPKGHIEPGESERDAATREVCEECGLVPEMLAVGAELARTVHFSASDEVKHTVWFRMVYSGDPARVKPQTDEDITILDWVSLAEARRRAEGSYSTIREVIDKLTNL